MIVDGGACGSGMGARKYEAYETHMDGNGGGGVG